MCLIQAHAAGHNRDVDTFGDAASKPTDGIDASLTHDVILNSVDRPAMAIAYAALDGRVSGDLGRKAFRRALVAERLDDDTIDRLDAMFTRRLLDPTLKL